MKTKLFLLTGLVCGGLLMVSCQKDTEFVPAVEEETIAADNGAELLKTDFVEPGDKWLADPLDNYPDPFTSFTNIEFRVIRPGTVSLKVFTENGELVRFIYEGYLMKGLYKTRFASYGLPAGTYIAELKLGNRICKEKMIKRNLDDPMPMDAAISE